MNKKSVRHLLFFFILVILIGVILLNSNFCAHVPDTKTTSVTSTTLTVSSLYTPNVTCAKVPVIEAYTNTTRAKEASTTTHETTTPTSVYENVNFSEYYYDNPVEAWVYASSVKVYRYPTSSSSVLCSVKSTNTVTVIGEYETTDGKDWYIISDNGNVGFVAAKTGSYNSLILKTDFVRSENVSKSTLIGKGKTVSDSTSKGRANNLSISSTATSIVVPNGAVFSLNGTTGPRTEAAGYKDAAIFQNGSVTNGLGGGVCQTSTTIHCAVLNAIENGYGLKVLEASKHSLHVSYVNSTKKEAMVNWGTNDFRFVNNTGKDIALVVTAKGQTVNAEIYFVD